MPFRKIAVGIFSCTLLGIAGFLVWKYGFDITSTEAKEGLGDLYDSAGDKLDEWDLPDWDLGDFSNVLDGFGDLSFGDLFDQDPKLGNNETLNWKDSFVQPNNGGLHLTLQNALDDTWQDEFDAAVLDWQESDALELSTARVAVDNTCERVDGVMVVCNANFGATGWVGINENSIMGGVIVSSVSKMNEYYLNNANFDHRRYTMCHELGHGFGLPHTDENPYNANLGNCLDYTDNPDENLEPGDVNMAKLRIMYKTRRLRRVGSDGAVVEVTELLVR